MNEMTLPSRVQTHDLKFQPWRSEVEHATSWSRRLPTILNVYEWAGKKKYALTWRPEWGLNPRSPTFQAGSFNHCTRAPTKHAYNYIQTQAGHPFARDLCGYPCAWSVCVCAKSSTHEKCASVTYPCVIRVSVQSSKERCFTDTHMDHVQMDGPL